MKQISMMVIAVLTSYLSVMTSDDTRDLFAMAISTQKKQNHRDARTIITANLDNKQLTDTDFLNFFSKAINVVTFSAQHHTLNAPTPISCRDLTELDLSNGTLTTFPIGSWLQKMPHLKKLNLSKNKINSITSPFLNKIECCMASEEWCSYSLSTLNLSNNQLTELDLSIINNTPQLENANLSHNQLTTVIVPDPLHHRKICTIQLHNTNLTEQAKSKLIQHTTHETRLYEEHKSCVMCSGFLFGMLAGIGSGFAAGYTIQPSFVGVPVGILLSFAIPTISIPLSMYSAYCCIPAEQRAYQPFKFEWDEKVENTDTLLELNVE